MIFYYKYASIPKSSFNKINILILPINTGEKYLKYSIHFSYICDYQPYESNFPYHEIRNFMTSFRDKLYHHIIGNKIKFNFLIIWFGKMSSSKNLCLHVAQSQKSKEWLTSKNSACNHTLLNRKNQKFQLLMAGFLWVTWLAAIM